MTALSKRISWSISAIVVALLLALLAFSSIFTRFGVANELAIHAIGIASFGFALVASILVYPLRTKIGFRVFLVFCILMAVLLGIEFLGGFLWYSLDKFVRYEQRR